MSRPISIHTPHAGSDSARAVPSDMYTDFNPHSPCGERLLPLPLLPDHQYFNPHSPCGERRRLHRKGADLFLFQSTLPMRGATGSGHSGGKFIDISIHTPHAGSDLSRIDKDLNPFQISIHTPHAGSDQPGAYLGRRFPYFNPHSPCGERLLSAQSPRWCTIFQSTLPMRGATTAARISDKL